MDKQKITNEIWQRAVKEGKSDISDIVDRYGLSKPEQEAVAQYADALELAVKKHEDGSIHNELDAFRKQYKPVTDEAEGIVTIGAGLLGGALAYLATRNAEMASYCALVAGLGARIVENLFHPVAMLLGKPSEAEVEGSASNAIRAKNQALQALKCYK